MYFFKETVLVLASLSFVVPIGQQPDATPSAVNASLTTNANQQDKSAAAVDETEPWDTPTGLLRLLAQKLNDKGSRVGAYRKIASAQIAAGDNEQALATLNQALKIALSNEIKNGQTLGLRDVASDLAEAGDFQHALDVAEQIEPLAARSDALSNIAVAYFAVQQDEQGKATLDLAVEVAQKIGQSPTGFTSSALTGISSDLTKAGKIKLAVDVALKIQDADRKASALKNIGWALAVKEDNEQALSVLNQAVDATQQINNTRMRGTQLRNIILALMKAKAFNRALEVALTIEDPFERRSALGQIVLGLIEAGETQRAVQIAQVHLVGQKGYASTALEQIIRTLIRAEDFDHAIELTHALDATAERGLLSAEITKRLAIAGKIDQAMEVTQKSGTARDQSIALSAIATVLIHDGNTKGAQELLDKAMELSQTIENARDKPAVLCNIASAMIRTGNTQRGLTILNQALELAGRIQSEKDKQFVRWMIALAMIDAGTQTKSIETLRQAEKLIEEIENVDFRLIGLRAVARAYFDMGDKQQALRRFNQAAEVARTIPDAKAREHALASNASALANAGEFNSAIELVQTIEDSRIQASALRSVLTPLRKPEDASEVFETIKGIEDQRTRTLALNLMISSLFAAGEIDQAFELTETMAEVKIADLQLWTTARRLARVGEIEDAIKVGRHLESQSYQARTLNEIAFVLATEPIPKAADDKSVSLPVRRLKKSFTLEEQQLARQIVEIMQSN